MSDQTADAELPELLQQIADLKSAKDGYKKIALQAVEDLKYVKRISTSTYVERRLEEVQKEIAAVKDQA